MSDPHRTTRLPRLYPEQAPVSWPLSGHLHQGVITAHEERTYTMFITVAWSDGRTGRFVEARLPPGMVITGGAHDTTQPLPVVRAGATR